MGEWKRIAAGALCLCIAWTADAADEQPEYGASLEPQRIVVTASRIPTPVDAAPETVTVFAAAPAGDAAARPVRGSALGGVGLAEARQYRDVADVLRATPGASITSYGTRGSMQTVRLRGMESNHTGFFLDGMPMDDPLSTDRRTNLANYSLDNIGQLEVLRGPQSASYGSNAMAGVVNITSKKGEGPFSGFASTEAGSHGTILTRLGAQAGNARGDFSFGGSYQHTDGWSAADKRNGNREKDGFDQGSVNLRLGLNAGDNLRFDLFTNATQSRFQYDGWVETAPWVWEFGDVHNLMEENERYMIRPQVTLDLLDGRWVQKVGFGYLSHDRKYKSDAAEKNRYQGTTTKFDYQSVFHTHENNTILAGVDVITESGEYTHIFYGPNKTPARDIESSTTTGVYLENNFNWREQLYLTAGVRFEHHDDFGSRVTWKASAMYALPTGTKLKAAAGTGFSTPSFYALHIGYPDPGWPTLPNPDLAPERSFNWDIGFEQSFCNDRITFGSAFFWNRVKNKIVGNFNSTYANIDSYRTWGVESFARFAVTDTLAVSLQHTWLRNKESGPRFAAGRTMDQRPKHQGGIDVDWSFLGKGVLTGGVHYVGGRPERTTIADHNMPSYTIARVAASWKATDNLEVFGRVENLLNKKYQEYYGYGTERVSFYAGMTLSF